MGFEPTTLRDLVGYSNHCRLYGEQGPKLLIIESPVAQWLEHPIRSWRVVGSNPIWDSDFSEYTFIPEFTLSIKVKKKKKRKKRTLSD